MISYVLDKETMNWINYDVEEEFHAIMRNWKGGIP